MVEGETISVLSTLPKWSPDQAKQSMAELDVASGVWELNKDFYITGKVKARIKKNEAITKELHRLHDTLPPSCPPRLRDIVSATFPAWEVLHEMPASPRTFQRFTQRTGGLVGGVPRRVGLKQYLEPLRRPLDTGLYLVGDSVFLGQSTLAAAVGGQWVASSILKRRLGDPAGDLRPIPSADRTGGTKIYGK